MNITGKGYEKIRKNLKLSTRLHGVYENCKDSYVSPIGTQAVCVSMGYRG